MRVNNVTLGVQGKTECIMSKYAHYTPMKLPGMLFSFVAALTCGSCLIAAAPPLFDNGKSAWEIRLPTQPAPAEQYAAEELQAILKKISGAELRITPSDTINDGPAIVLGTPKTSREIASAGNALTLPDDDTETLAVKTIGNKLYLAGNQPRGVLYAVYSFLGEELGCRWFWPGDDGEFIPAKTTWSLPEINRHSTAAFRYREMTPCGMHYHVPTEIWMARNFLNRGSRTVAIRDRMGFVRGGGGHRVAIGAKNFETHKELFSVLNGKRDPAGEAGCWSNPDFTKFAVANIVKYARDNNLETLNIFPADIIPRCECDACSVNPDKSSRWYDYYAKLVDLIREELPNMRFGGIAYQEFRAVPVTPVQKLEYVQHCQYSRCYVHKIGHPGCSLNEKTMDELKRWQEKAPMGIYGYEFDVYKDPMYLPFWNMLQDEMKIFRDIKLVFMKTELGVRYRKELARPDTPQLAHRLSNYIYAQLIWNPDLDMDKTLQDWCAYVYGPAAPELLDYHRRMAAAWDQMSIHLTYFGAKPDGTAKVLLNDELVKHNKQLFAAALKRLGDQPENKRWRDEVELEAALFDKWERIYQVSKDQAAIANLPMLTGDNRFAEVAKLPMRSKKGEHLPAETRMYWNEEGLHLQVDCLGRPDLKTLPTDFNGQDLGSWGPDNVEIFLTDHKISPFWQIAVNPTGVVYEAIGTDTSWNPKLITKQELIPGGWRATIKLPFAVLDSTPKAGDQWQIVVNRNSKPEASGFPFASYHDIASGATVYFSNNTNPDRRLTWVSRSDLENPRFNNMKSTLTSSGWQFQHAHGADAARGLDLSDSKLICMEMYKNNFTPEFFSEQLLPAVKDGAVVVFISYFWINKLPEFFQDETFTVKFTENAISPMKTTSILQTSFATTPNDVKKILTTAPSGTLEPAFPEKWEFLLQQMNKNHEEKPHMIARPYGKGMVVISGDIRGNTRILENILDYNRAIKRP